MKHKKCYLLECYINIFEDGVFEENPLLALLFEMYIRDFILCCCFTVFTRRENVWCFDEKGTTTNP